MVILPITHAAVYLKACRAVHANAANKQFGAAAAVHLKQYPLSL